MSFFSRLRVWHLPKRPDDALGASAAPEGAAPEKPQRIQPPGVDVWPELYWHNDHVIVVANRYLSAESYLRWVQVVGFLSATGLVILFLPASQAFTAGEYRNLGIVSLTGWWACLILRMARRSQWLRSLVQMTGRTTQIAVGRQQIHIAGGLKTAQSRGTIAGDWRRSMMSIRGRSCM